jgi:hypothetical protein
MLTWKLMFAGLILSLLPACGEKTDLVKRGEYLVTIAGCHDCHTPKVQNPQGIPIPDQGRLLSGHPEKSPYPTWSPEDGQNRHAIALTNEMMTAWAGPWGVSFAANLTPDKETGIREWSQAMFIQALRTGKHQGQADGRDILPPMPWFNTRQATDEDLQAIWAYLRSLPPVKNQVPFPVPPNGKPSS